MIRKALVALIVAGLLVVGCAHEEPKFVGFFAPYKNCRARYAEIDAKVDAAGVRDATYYRVPGYPYFRTDRVLASFRTQVHTFDEISGWVRRMRELDQESREFEYFNLGFSTQERATWRDELLNCGHGLAAVELDSPAALAHLMTVVEPTDDYSSFARVLGVYPLAVPLLKDRIEKQQAQIKQDFSRPLAELDSPGPLTLWQVKPSEDLKDIDISDPFTNTILDELGFPGLTDSSWRAIAEANAPQLWVETGGDQDRLGAPTWSKSGLVVDVSQPQMNYQVTFTRFGDRRLAQITYFMWFPAHANSGKGPAGTNIDGMVWRVTLDQHAHPLVYESMRTSGSDHRWFPVQTTLVPRVNPSYWQQPTLFPQEQLPKGLPVLRLQASSHTLRRIVATDQATAADSKTYELRRYEDLLMLPKPDGGSRDLFGPDGLVAGTEGSDPDPVWMLASGVRDPGALRELGHHVIDYVGRLEFDDAYVLESVFVPPPPSPAPPPVAEDNTPGGPESGSESRGGL